MLPKLVFRISLICTLALVLILANGTIVSAQDIPVKTERKKENKKRIKQKKLKGDKGKSNKRQLRQIKNKTRSKYGDRTSKGDITGRKFKQKKTPRTTYARPAVSPYAGRKVRKDRDRAGRTPPPDFRKTPKGEKAWRGDISGKRRVRTASGSSARRKTYRPTNTSARTASRNAERSTKSSRAVVSTRSASKPSERARSVEKTIPMSASGGGKIRRKRNPYAGKDIRRGEQSTDKDIAGRKLRTRGKMSAKGAPKRGYRTPDTYYGRKSSRDGGRFSRGAMQQGGYTSGSRSSEQAARVKRSDPVTKNFRSPRAGAGRVPVNPNVTKEPGRGSGRIKAKRTTVRSISRNSERQMRIQGTIPKSISGTARIKKPKSPYAGREQRAGERSTDKDIAGRKLRTRNFRSRRPEYGGAISRPDPYYQRNERSTKVKTSPIPSYVPGKESLRSSNYKGRFKQGDISPAGYYNARRSKYQGDRKAQRPVTGGGGSISGRIWNNKGQAIQSELPSTQTRMATQYQGRTKSVPSGYYNPNIGRYSGETRARRPVTGGGGSISGRRWNNKGQALQSDLPSPQTRMATQFQGRTKSVPAGYYNPNIGRYKGDRKARRPVTGGGGSISSRRWNNKGQAIQSELPSAQTRMATQYQGRTKSVPAGYYNPNIGRYKGDRKAQRPVTGGGSISGRRWNNKGQAIQSELPSAQTRMATQYQGRTKSVPAGYYNPNIGRYKGDRKARRPVTGGGGSISGRRWNNKGQAIQSDLPSAQTRLATQFQGRTKSVPAGYYNPNIGRYKGDRKIRRPVTGGGGSISGRRWNNKEQAIQSELPSAQTRMATKYQGNLIPNPGYYNVAIGRYRGDFKTRKPKTGGGSVSGKLWNNKESALPRKIAGEGTRRATQYQGNMAPNPGHYNVAISKYRGENKVRKPSKGGGGTISGKLWNNDEQAIQVRLPGKDGRAGSQFQGNLNAKSFKGKGQPKGTEYGRSNSVIYITPGSAKKYGLYKEDKAKKFNGSNYGRASSVIYITPGSAKKYGLYKEDKAGRSLGTNYGRTKSVVFITPGKAKRYGGFNKVEKIEKAEGTTYGRANAIAFYKPSKIKNYGGFVRLNTSVSRKQMHPSSNYTKGVSKNGKEEKEKTFKFGIWWSSLFKKNKSQPQNLKSKDRKPRYDKREKDLWYE